MAGRRKVEFVLRDSGWNEEQSPEELLEVVLHRLGLTAKKTNATAKMHLAVLELLKRRQKALREENPSLAIIPVEELAKLVGIARQTFYSYLPLFLESKLVNRGSCIINGAVFIGYELNGNTLAEAVKRVVNRLDELNKKTFGLAASIEARFL